MREKQAAGISVALAGVAVATGLVFASAGGMFQSSEGYVAPPALSSSDQTGVSGTAGSSTSAPVTVPPSPSWRVADAVTPRATPLVEVTDDAPTSERESTSQRASRTPRSTTPDDEPTTTRRGSRTTTTQPGE